MGWEDPLGKGMATHPSILPGESHGQRSLEDYSPWGHKKSNTTERRTLTYTHRLTESFVGISRQLEGPSQWLSGKEPACNAGDVGDAGLIPGLGRFPWRMAAHSSILA